jgi:hypothetical protein
MYASPKNDHVAGRFPAMMRYKLNRSKKTENQGSSHSPNDRGRGPYAWNKETNESDKKEPNKEEDYHQSSNVMEQIQPYGVHEQFMSNYMYYHHAPPPSPLRTPTRPPSRHFTPIVSPPQPLRVTHQYRHNPPHYYPVQFPKQHRTDISTLVGNPSLNIHRVHLPPHLLHLLDSIVLGCEAYAETQPKGWMTDLYSLTKQDVALRELPHLFDASKPIIAYITKCMRHLWGIEVTMDKNQPHILKYDAGHAGVEMHHDKCDITANLCLSRTTSYVAGG